MPPSTQDRRATWQGLYTQTLPSLARAKHPSQRKWPVTLDHCFGRIILDRVVGQGEVAWTERLKGPAIRNMSDAQVDACIALGQQIASGEADLVELDEASLAARGKRSKHFAAGGGGGEAQRGAKRTRETRAVESAAKLVRGSEDDTPVSDGVGGEGSGSEEEEGRKVSSPASSPEPGVKKAGGVRRGGDDDEAKARELGKRRREDASLEELRELVRSSSLVPHRKEILLALLQVPRGKWTTYGAISDFLRSSPRAIGNGMRNNPFAPEVPCHRVLAADGKIGGYCGQWGEGDLIDKKRRILREEGVRFDVKGKVVGAPWRGFKKQS